MSLKRKTNKIGTLKNMPTYHYSCHKKISKTLQLIINNATKSLYHPVW